MYPYIRAALMLFRASRKPKLPELTSTVSSEHRAWPWDTDIFGELNHGRILTLFELNRWELAQRLGLIRHIRKRKRGLTVAGVSIRYRRRVPIFSRYRVETRPLGWDDKFMYGEQQMWIGDLACNQMLIRLAVIGRDGAIEPRSIASDLGYDPTSPALPDWVQNWISAEGTRPWPPEPI